VAYKPITVGAVLAEKEPYKKPEVLWTGTPVSECNICDTKIEEVFIDGATWRGAWAIMCPNCYASHGIGLGLGKGQKFVKQDDERWLKVEG